MYRGYIKIWRKVTESGLLQMPNTLALFMHILLNASHQQRKVGTPGGVITIERGQYMSGRIKLASELKQSEREIRTSLSRLVELGIIDQQTTNRYSIYTIVNYSNYQDCDQQTTSTTTSRRPADDQQTTTKQELKECKEVNNTPPKKKVTQEYGIEFLQFWEAYPQKTGKHVSHLSWIKMNPSVDEVLKALSWQIKTDRWTKESGKYIPDPATYLNQRRWQDESPVDKPVQRKFVPA